MTRFSITICMLALALLSSSCIKKQPSHTHLPVCGTIDTTETFDVESTTVRYIYEPDTPVFTSAITLRFVIENVSSYCPYILHAVRDNEIGLSTSIAATCESRPYQVILFLQGQPERFKDTMYQVLAWISSPTTHPTTAPANYTLITYIHRSAKIAKVAEIHDISISTIPPPPSIHTIAVHGNLDLATVRAAFPQLLLPPPSQPSQRESETPPSHQDRYAWPTTGTLTIRFTSTPTLHRSITLFGIATDYYLNQEAPPTMSLESIVHYNGFSVLTYRLLASLSSHQFVTAWRRTMDQINTLDPPWGYLRDLAYFHSLEKCSNFKALLADIGGHPHPFPDQQNWKIESDIGYLQSHPMEIITRFSQDNKKNETNKSPGGSIVVGSGNDQ